MDVCFPSSNDLDARHARALRQAFCDKLLALLQ